MAFRLKQLQLAGAIRRKRRTHAKGTLASIRTFTFRCYQVTNIARLAAVITTTVVHPSILSHAEFA